MKGVKTTAEVVAFSTRDKRLEDFPVVLDDFYPKVQTADFIAENIMTLGDINATVKGVAHHSPLDVNPLKADAGKTYEQTQRMSFWIKVNSAMKILRGE